MKPYFAKMPTLGRPLTQGQRLEAEENQQDLKTVETQVAAAVEAVRQAGFADEKINARGQLTVWQRLDELIDPGTWHPCTPSTTRMPTPREPTTSSTAWAASPANGPW